MDLSKLGIKNLRCFDSGVNFDIKPLNILVGKNSSGKSTIARLFPLMRQSLETKTKGPILWYGQYVDFGSFDTATSKGSEDDSIQFHFEIKLKPEKKLFARQKLFFRRFQPSAQIHEAITAIVDITLKFNQSTNESYTAEYSIGIFENKITVKFEEDRFLSELIINGSTIKIPDKQFGLGRGSNLLPELTFYRPSKFLDPDGEEHEGFDPFNFLDDTKLINFIRYRSHANLSKDKIRSFISLLGIASDSVLKNRASNFRSSSINLDAFAHSLTNSEARFNQLKEFYLLHITSDISELINSKIKKSFSNVKYIKPVRATAQRYYRYQELSIEEIDAEGANIAMFLESLPTHDKLDLNNWLESKIGITVNPKREGGHIALFVTDTHAKSSQNIADMGFGYSQVLPILVQAWLSQNESERMLPTTTREPTSALVIEQPELHLHPDFQAKLATVFGELAAISKKRDDPFPIIIETHSPQIVNRFGEMIEANELAPEDIGVYLFEESDGKHTLREANFNHKGALENWPYGFFEAGE